MLTRKQHKLLLFIDSHLKQTGFSPSFDEMREAMGLRSKSGIHRLISGLEERGSCAVTIIGHGRWKLFNCQKCRNFPPTWCVPALHAPKRKP